MRLSDLLEFEKITIQCHDNPDADAISSGYAVYLYLKEHGKDVSLIYGGYNVIRKSNLVLLVDTFDIPIRHVERLDKQELLVTVDCQYGEGNVTRFEAETVAVIDHHTITGPLPELNEVRSNLGACATLVWQMLKDENYDINANTELATALYYGLYTDTNSFSEIDHPLDKDLRDQAVFDRILMSRLRNANLSLEELETAGAALLHCDYIEEHRFAIVKVGPCDPNMLGIISDMVLEVDSVDSCLAFNVLPTGIKFSVRSCVKEIKASELAKELSLGIGNGGGHLDKAGGTIKMELLVPAYMEYCEKLHLTPRMEMEPDGKHKRPTDSAIKSLLNKRAEDYFNNTEIIYCENFQMDEAQMQSFHKRSIPFGYVYARDLYEEGTPITVRSMDGDMDIKVQQDTVIVIGFKGEIHLTREELFKSNYRIYDWKFHMSHNEYNPTIKNSVEGTVIFPLDYAKVCIPTGEAAIRVKRLDHNVKLFTQWDNSVYRLGETWDYLAMNGEDVHDVYIIEKRVFEECYEPEDGQDKDGVQAVIFELRGALMNEKNEVYAEIPYLLEELKLRGVSVAVVSTEGKKETVRLVEEYLGGADCVAGGEKSARGHHNHGAAADLCGGVMKALGVSSEKVIYVGSSEDGLKAALADGAACVAPTWTHPKRRPLRAIGVKRLVDWPLQLLYHM